MRSIEAVVIGGGPAGLSAALGLAKAGFSVSVFEQRQEWLGRVCGSFLSPEASMHLKWLGILNNVLEKSVVTGSVLVSYGNKKSFVVPARQDLRTGLAVPRKDLEEILLSEAVKNGVEVKRGFRVTRLSKTNEKNWRGSVYTADQKIAEEFESRVVVCADGRFSAFREVSDQGKWIGWSVEYKNAGLWPGELWLRFIPRGYIGCLTFKDGWTNVGGLIHSDLLKGAGKDWKSFLQGILQTDDVLRARFKDAVQISSFKSVAALPFGRYMNEDSNLFLAGDCAGVCDPFMGEGIARALSSGPMLFQAFKDKSRAPNGIQEARAEYGRLWDESYSARIKIGASLRWVLSSNGAVSGSLDLISHWGRLQKLLLNSIHGSSVLHQFHNS